MKALVSALNKEKALFPGTVTVKSRNTVESTSRYMEAELLSIQGIKDFKEPSHSHSRFVAQHPYSSLINR